MVIAVLELLILLSLAGVTGWLIAGPLWACLLALLAVCVYAMALAWKIARFDRWLSAPSLRLDPPWRGIWLEMALRIQRILRQQEKLVTVHEKRLQDFLLAIQASPNGVILLDEEDRIEWCNNTAAAHLGLDAIKDRMQHVVHLVRDPVFARYFSQAEHESEAIIEGRSSSFVNSQKLCVQLHNYGEGKRLLLTRDITAVAQADAMRRDFVANVSHEIRTPLTVLGGFIETLQSLPLDREQIKKYLELMSVQSDRMQSLVSDLLTLSQLEASQLAGVQESVSLSQLINQVVIDAHILSNNLASKAGGTSHHLVINEYADVELLGSHSELMSAFSNLISNAVRYTPLGGKIHLSWTHSLDGWVFAVEDSGPGISAEHLPRLSERFYRVDRSRSRETGGTGLGLAITKHVMQRHGGELRIKSVLGRGSTFELVFPETRVRTFLN